MRLVVWERPALEEVSHALAALRSVHGLEAFRKRSSGNLTIGGGAQKLLNADFIYNVPSWRPEVRYTSTSTHGDLTIRQPGQGHAQIGHTRYEWDLALNNDVPMDLNLHFGAGEAHLELGSLALRSVDVGMGVGKLEMDLRGNPKHNYDVRIHGGIGSIRLIAV